jgi:hypothetical protein
MEKRDIALQQLFDSARLYEQGHYVSALTLVSASEEIFGKIAEKRTGSNQMKNEIEYLKSIYQDFKKPCPPDKELKNRINRAKNEIKHNDSGENLWIESDFENEFVFTFVKAIKNYYNAYKELPKDRKTLSLFEYLTL